MMTVITETTVRDGQQQQWDAAYRDRLTDARQQEGWVGMVLLAPEGEPNKRLVVGTWRSKEDWERWHTTQPFQETRDRLNAASVSDRDDQWYQVITETF